MPNFIKPLPDVPDHLDGFTIAASVDATAGAPVVSLRFSMAVVSLAGHTHQLNGDLAPFLTAQQITAFTNAALNLFSQAQAQLLT